ncbi:hypothetical protein TrRE_jg9025, partial [Triparma retinervis]
MYPKSEQPQSPSCSVSGVESSGRSFGKRISTHISQRVSEGLSHSADLHGLGFKSEIKDTAMFARGIVQIIRALHCYPCRRAQVERIQFSPVNLWFLKLYHNSLYRRLVYTNLALLILTPIVGFDPATSTASIMSIRGFDGFARIATPLNILVVFVDIAIKCMAYSELAYFSPRRHLFNLDREVVSTYTMIFCNFFLLFQFCNYGWRPEVPNQMGVLSVFVRTPLFRSVLVLARSHNLQHDILSKVHSLRKSLPIIFMSLAIFLVLCIGLTVLIGVVIVPDMRMTSFYKSSSNYPPGAQELFNFNSSSPDTQNLIKMWQDELDSSFKSIFRTMITLFIGMTYSNYYKIFRLLWDNTLRDSPDVIRSIPRVVASIFLSFFGVFVIVMDCIIVAVCVNAFAEHRSKTAAYSMKQEIANLESAFDFLTRSANKDHITKDIWMEILLASGRKFSKKRSLNNEFVEASILIFEMIDTDNSDSLEKSEFVNACVKGFLGTVKKKPIQVPGSKMKKKGMFHLSEHSWGLLSIAFDTVGANTLWIVNSLVQLVFVVYFWDALSKITDEAIEETQNRFSREIFNMSYTSILEVACYDDADAANTCFPQPPLGSSFTAEDFQDEFSDNFTALYRKEMGTVVSVDTFFLALALLECIFRVMAYKRRSRVYPTFQKRVVPKMELIDFSVVLLIIATLLAYELSLAEDGGRFHRLALATRGIRMFRFFPAIVRFRSADHHLLLKREQSGRKLPRNDWLKSLFNFEMRIDINYDKKRLQSKSSKGPVMRLANTFVQCFYFALRQAFLVSLVLYIFACLFQSVLYWVPCTTFGDYLGTDKMLKGAYLPEECGRNIVDYGYLNVSLVFRDFGRTLVSIGVAFFMKDPQEIFGYVIQLADHPDYDELANKRLIFTLFFAYYISMILFIFNFVTAEIMQLSDLLRFNMLHQVEMDFLKPDNSDFVYCIEWKLNLTSRRGAMIIEYYTKKLNNDASDDDRSDDNDEEYYSENEGGLGGGVEDDAERRSTASNTSKGSRFMKRSTIGGKTVTVRNQIKRSSTARMNSSAEDEDGVELQE